MAISVVLPCMDARFECDSGTELHLLFSAPLPTANKDGFTVPLSANGKVIAWIEFEKVAITRGRLVFRAKRVQPADGLNPAPSDICQLASTPLPSGHPNAF